MPTSTTTRTLRPRTSRVQDLIRINLQSARDLRNAFGAVTDRVLRRRFHDMAAHRLGNAAELEEALTWQEQPGVTRRLRTSAQRARIASYLHRGNREVTAVLDQAECAEDAIDRAYQRALRESDDGSLAAVIERQHEDVRRAHAIISDLHGLMNE